MDPVLSEYDLVVSSLKRELDTYKLDQYDLRAQIHKLVDENRKLLFELKESVQARIIEPKVEDLINDLEQQLFEAINAKTTLLKSQQITIENSTKDIERRPNVSEVERRISQIRDHYTKGLSALSDELAETNQQLVRVKEELKQKTASVQELELNLETRREGLIAREKTIEELRSENSELMQKIIDLENFSYNSQQALDNCMRELGELKEGHSKLVKLNKELEDNALELNAQKYEYQQQAKKSIMASETALLCQKELEFKEKQALKSIVKLKSSLAQEVDHATLRYRNETRDVRLHLEKKITNLESDIKELLVENSEKQSLFEKAVREKQAVESNLDALLAETSSIHAVPASVYDGMCTRLTLAEKSRDKALFQVQSLETSLKNLERSATRELEFNTLGCKSLRNQLQKLKMDTNKILNERSELTDELSALKKRCSEKEKALYSIQSKHKKELAELRQILQQQADNCKTQLKNNEQQCQKVVSEVQHLLEAQYKVNKKWKDTVQELTTKSELQVKQMAQEINKLNVENEELRRTMEKQASQIAIPLSLV